MSDGPRIPLDRARAAAALLFERWGLLGPASMVVGSVRRQRPLVGDVEIVAPLPASPRNDPLFEAINETMGNPWRDEREALFAGNAAPNIPGVIPRAARPIGSIVRGLKPEFAACSLLVQLADGADLPVQVYRYTRENAGWMILYRTGPWDFGRWFLWQWKRRFGIPVGDDHHSASMDGHLVDSSEQVVSVPTEEEAFQLAGVPFVPPERRDAFMERVQASREAIR